MRAAPVRRSSSSGALIFAWAQGHDLHLLLPAMIVLALIFHVAALLVFQLVYPQAGSNAIPAGRVLVPTSQSPGWQEAKVWVDAADPSKFSPIRPEIASKELPGAAEFIPSYMGGSLELRYPEDSVQQVLAAALPQFPISVAAELAPVPEAPDRRSEQQEIRILENGQRAAFELEGSSSLEEILQVPANPAFFLAAIGGDGRVRSVFLQRTSGSEVWDEHAKRELRRGRFATSDLELRWAWVAVELGSTGPEEFRVPVEPVLLP